MTRQTCSLMMVPIVILALGAGTAWADWTASGTFTYVDREFDGTGFTGFEPAQPVRFADVEVVDANAPSKKAVIASGTTDASGNYSISVVDSKTRDVYVRVLTRSDYTADLNGDVRQNSTGKPSYYAAATNTINNHNPGSSVDFGTAEIQIGQGGEAFNVYDQLVRGMDYLGSLLGSRPGSDKYLFVVWGPNNGIGGSNYCPGCMRINLRDSAGYDDTVVLHEVGHYSIHEWSTSTSPGGSHGFFQCNQDIRLAFDEGFATYFGNSALRHANVPNSHLYVRTNGASGTGNLVRLGNLETDTEFLCEGSENELNVSAVLWDISDGPSSPDDTPGVDDAHDQLDLADTEVWEVMTDQVAGQSDISFETFWDGWFLAPVQNGFRSQMIDLANEKRIEFFEDGFEANDSSAQARSVTPDGTVSPATLFSDPELDGAGAVDEDYFFFAASSGQSYVVETKNLLSDANTYLEILDSDGQTVLDSNDDRSAGDPSSRVDWTAPRTDQFYVHVNHAPDLGDYGSYDLVVTAQAPTDNDNDGYDTSTDCNDDDPTINPGATEVCDGVDQDCDGVVDNGFDVDGDGYTTCGGDCDDSNPAVNPGAAEVPGNGIDDNCNGQIDEQPSTDTVTITKATWNKGPKRLKVEAISDQQPDVTLTVVGFGVMTFDSGAGLYKYQSPNGTPNPGTVTVESSGGGSDVATVN